MFTSWRAIQRTETFRAENEYANGLRIHSPIFRMDVGGIFASAEYATVAAIWLAARFFKLDALSFESRVKLDSIFKKS